MVQQQHPWRGIFTIPVTPFDEQGELDLDALRRVVEFSCEQGAHGIVHPVMASEFFTLSDDERLRMIPIVVRQVNGRVPVVIGVAGVCTQSAVTFARAARDAGADAVIAMPPYVQKYAPDDVLRYYEAIARAFQGPVFIQNAGLAALSRDQVLRILREVERVHYVKEEVPPAHHNIGALVRAGEPRLWGVFGGSGGNNMIAELSRGAAGNMPACHLTAILVRIFELWERSERDAARTLHWRVQPRMQKLGPAKRHLVRLGVLTCARTRAAGPAWDDEDEREAELAWTALQEQLRTGA